MKQVSSLAAGFFVSVAFTIINPEINIFNWQWWIAFIIVYIAKDIETYYWNKST